MMIFWWFCNDVGFCEVAAVVKAGTPSLHSGAIAAVMRLLLLLLPQGGNRRRRFAKQRKPAFPGGSADAVGGCEEALVAAHASVGEEAEDEGEDEEADAAEEDGSGVVVGSG